LASSVKNIYTSRCFLLALTLLWYSLSSSLKHLCRQLFDVSGIGGYGSKIRRHFAPKLIWKVGHWLLLIASAFLPQLVLVYEFEEKMTRPSFSMIYGHLRIRCFTLFWGILFAVCSRFCSRNAIGFQNVFSSVPRMKLLTALHAKPYWKSPAT